MNRAKAPPNAIGGTPLLSQRIAASDELDEEQDLWGRMLRDIMKVPRRSGVRPICEWLGVATLDGIGVGTCGSLACGMSSATFGQEFTSNWAVTWIPASWVGIQALKM